MPEGRRNPTHCPCCGREIDKMRAGSVGIFSGKITYFCSRECKETFSMPGSRTPGPPLAPSSPAGAGPSVRQAGPAQAISRPPESGTAGSGSAAGPVMPGEFRGAADPQPSAAVPADVADRQLPRWRLLRWVLPAVIEGCVISVAWLAVDRGWIAGSPALGVSLVLPAMIVGVALAALEWRTDGMGRALDDLLVVAGTGLWAIPGIFELARDGDGSFVPRVFGPLGVLAAVWAARALEAGLATGLEESPDLGSLHARGALASLAGRPEGWGKARFVRHPERLGLALALAAIPAGGAVLAASWIVSGSGGMLPWSMAAAVVLCMAPRLVRNVYPASTAAALLQGRAAGTVFADDRSIELAGRVDAMILRKRGVLAEAATEILDLRVVGDLQRDVLLSLLASCEEIAAGSEIAAAIQRFARAEGVKPGDTRLTRHVPSRGIQSTSPFGEIFVGSRLFLIENGISVGRGEDAASEAERRGHTVIFVSVNRRVEAVMVLANRLRETARTLVDWARRDGIATILITGDSARTAEVIGSQCGVDQVRPEIGIAGREREIERVRDSGHRLAVLGAVERGAPRTPDPRDLVVGVGWNGSLPLEPPWGVGVASDDLSGAMRAVEIARSARRSVTACTVLAAVAGVACLGLAASGLASPVIAALAANTVAALMVAIRPRIR